PTTQPRTASRGAPAPTTERAETTLIRGHIDHVPTTEIDSRRGPVTLTSVWLVDHHDHVPATKQPPTLYEIQFLNDKIHDWAHAITTRFHDNDRVLALVRDDVETATTNSTDGHTRTYIKTRG